MATPPSRSSAAVYVVSTALGLAFSVFLLLYAWQNALDTERREFAFESVSLEGAVTRSVHAADDVSAYLASLIEKGEVNSQAAFEELGRAALERHPYLLAAVFQRVRVVANASAPDVSPTTQWGENALKELLYGRLAASQVLFADSALRLGLPTATTFSLQTEPALYAVQRSGTNITPSDFEISAAPSAQDVLTTALASTGAVPAPPFTDGPIAERYLLVRAVPRYGTDQEMQRKADMYGVVTVLVDPGVLLGPTTLVDNVDVTLASESEGVVGRQILYSSKAHRVSAADSWEIARLTEDASIQFPAYSIKLLVGKAVRWRDTEHGLVYTALVLGAGVTLLLVALAHAREAQARELRERNIEIERQVLRQTRELAEARDQALSASRVKSDFLASMSHEIRTPLNAIIGMSDLLSETSLNEDQTKYVGIFRKAGEALLSLVNDILDLSKIEAGQLILERIEFDVRELIEHAMDLYALKTDEKGLALMGHIAADVPRRLVGDPTRLRQIVLNLIGNAIKFTDRGEIIVRVTRDVQAQHAGCLRFSVQDTGIGIPAEKRDAIFASFTQVDSSTTRKYGGTGLGLTISKRLVEMMGGRIWVDSEEGKGSTFHFTAAFLVVAGEGPSPEPQWAKTLAGLSVLVVDENSTQREILRELLCAHGLQVDEAFESAAAVERVQQAASEGRAYPLVICDGRIASEDNFAVICALRQAAPSTKAIVLLAPSTLTSDLTRVNSSGVEAYVVKPVKPADLIDAMNKVVAGPAKTPSELPAPSTALSSEASHRRLLLVEDMLDNRLLVKAYLKREAYDIDEAENGEVAVAKFKAGRYDVVLMDMQMPVMDGYAAARAIRAFEAEQGRSPTTIIALTAHAIREDIDRCLQAGCSAHLAKPVKKATLLQALGDSLSIPTGP